MASDQVPVESADTDIPARPDDQAGDEVAARLLLALTALYAQRSNHTAEEQQQYTELALGLIDKAGPAAHASAAARLRRHPNAPAVVVARLGDGQIPPDGDGGGQHAAAPDLPAQDRLQDFLQGHGQGLLQDRCAKAGPPVETAPLPIPADPEPGDGKPLDETSGSPPRCPASAEPTPLTAEFGEAFFAASPPERRRMLLEIGGARAIETGQERGRRFHVRIDVAPWRSRTGAFARDFQRLIDAPSNLCARILDDPSGEPMVVAARATGMPVAILQRILLLVSPAAHHSVERVYELTDLYHSLDRRAARDLLAAWRGAAGNAAMPDRKQAPVTNLRTRLRALNARIESKADCAFERAKNSAPSPE